MALASAVKGSERPPQLITWMDADGTAVDLTGATLSGKIRDASTGLTRAIVGSLTLTNAAGGVFRWDYDALDVATAGVMEVQFTAVYASDPTPGRTILANWEVREGI